MKKFLKSIAVMALMLITMTSMANNPKISLTSGIDSKSLIFEMDALSMESKIRMTDQNSQTIYSENILNANYSKRFNLKDLEIGTYNFIIENPISSLVYTFVIDNNEIKIENKEEYTAKPIFRIAGNKISINLFNGNQQKVDIEILNSSSDIVFQESTKGELIIGKVINFEKAIKGNYTIIVTNGKETYYQNIVIG
ncbi:hypothetical protein [Arenibacter echinorum]|uniref:Secreted protein (Por secretion system target) n=1 Tax=Arenibacter echinorum TaxID=440515 RepID=A0A327R4U1_9FLAO|nr:hypothetical protein [Arenibacter echinorum]RAJ11701.1 hypothetical protein LV92_02633 [Arenibacter echinorum]